ncbi:ACE1 transcriptional factor [Mycena indigotica]|uniref:ACE1 transcriptional factor n=1 Tax=Mycena indigotica TaxID=2126181 RepID=A0A8H6SKA1_9AGAR|nr:ACE1 transcriptional factor [Mycena indigotica]KAF7301280.1 ACE1 transcriptional factor [Mycena indigotica]
MVLISDKKYACETCIKGHRSSACKHTDRPLFEIKKKGRPVTQCEHCRELRKTKQVHVKCICEVKEPPSPTSLPGKPKKKGTPVIPAEAAFPHGVPQELASDSEQGGSAPSLSGCSCNAGTGECHCCTPRTRPSQRKPSAPTSTIPSPTQPSSPNPDSPSKDHRTPSHHILARIAELRPVLPRMSARDAALQAQTGGQHDLFHGSGHHHADHFSPYGRAYAHEGGFYQQDARSVESLVSVNSISSHLSSRSQGKNVKAGSKGQAEHAHGPRSASFDGQPGTFSGFFGVNQVPQAQAEWRLPPSLTRASGEPAPYPRSEPSFPLTEDVSGFEGNAYPRSEGGAQQERVTQDMTNMRMCGCGETCACPGCALHNPTNRSTSSSPRGCVDAACGDACLDCTMLELSGFTSFGDAPTKKEDDMSSPFEPFENEIPTQPPEAQVRLESYDIDAERFDIDLELENYDPGVPYGPVNAFEQIDEWIQALPPPPPSGTVQSPFEFPEGELALEHSPGGFDLQGAAPPTWGSIQMFDVDAEQMSLAGGPSTHQRSASSESRLTGLSGTSPDLPGLAFSHSRGSSGAFLTVPGPDDHRRSRSSSSASSDVSSGIFGGAAAAFSPGSTPLEHGQLPATKQLQQPPPMELSMMVMQHPVLTIFPPPPVSGIAVSEFMDDEQMSFY